MDVASFRSKAPGKQGSGLLGGEDPLEKGMATHSSILAWRVPWAEKPGRGAPRSPSRPPSPQRSTRHGWGLFPLPPPPSSPRLSSFSSHSFPSFSWVLVLVETSQGLFWALRRLAGVAAVVTVPAAGWQPVGMFTWVIVGKACWLQEGTRVWERLCIGGPSPLQTRAGVVTRKRNLDVTRVEECAPHEEWVSFSRSWGESPIQVRIP